MSDRFPAMEMAKANEQCSRRDQVQSALCPECDLKVMLHCDNCKVQVTGCACTAEERFGEGAGALLKKAIGVEVSINRAERRKAREELRRRGLWIPENN